MYERQARCLVTDIVFVIIAVVFFLLGIGYVAVCARLMD
jgi:hypothetical protein